MNKITIFYSLFIIPLLVLGLILRFTHPYLCLGAICLLLFTTDKHTTGIFLLLFGGILGGVVRSLFPVLPLYGTMLNIIGLILIIHFLPSIFLERRNGITCMMAVFLLFISTYLYSVHNDESFNKLFRIIYNGTIFFLAYYTFDKSKLFSSERIGILLILTSLFLLSYSQFQYNIGPSSFLDFNWLRSGLGNYRLSTGETVIISYQEIGLDLVYAMAFIFAREKTPRNAWALLTIVLYLVLMSGARQAIICSAIVFFVRFALLSSEKSVKRLIVSFFSFLLLVGFYDVLQHLNIDVVNNTLNSSEDDERILIWTSAIELFWENPIFGAGLGGFHYYVVNWTWPHNLILELLCECGLYGTIIASIIILSFLSNNKISFKHLTSNNVFYFIPFVVIFTRTMVSGDFTESIGLFSALFAISVKPKQLIRNRVL